MNKVDKVIDTFSQNTNILELIGKLDDVYKGHIGYLHTKSPSSGPMIMYYFKYYNKRYMFFFADTSLYADECYLINYVICAHDSGETLCVSYYSERE